MTDVKDSGMLTVVYMTTPGGDPVAWYAMGDEQADLARHMDRVIAASWDVVSRIDTELLEKLLPGGDVVRLMDNPESYLHPRAGERAAVREHWGEVTSHEYEVRTLTISSEGLGTDGVWVLEHCNADTGVSEILWAGTYASDPLTALSGGAVDAADAYIAPRLDDAYETARTHARPAGFDPTAFVPLVEGQYYLATPVLYRRTVRREWSSLHGGNAYFRMFRATYVGTRRVQELGPAETPAGGQAAVPPLGDGRVGTAGEAAPPRANRNGDVLPVPGGYVPAVAGGVLSREAAEILTGLAAYSPEGGIGGRPTGPGALVGQRPAPKKATPPTGAHVLVYVDATGCAVYDVPEGMPAHEATDIAIARMFATGTHLPERLARQLEIPSWLDLGVVYLHLPDEKRHAIRAAWGEIQPGSNFHWVPRVPIQQEAAGSESTIK